MIGLAASRHAAARAAADGAFRMPSRLTTERLSLTEVGAADIDDNQRLYGDAAVARFLGGVCDAAEAFRRLAVSIGQWRLLGFGHYALRTKDGRYLGFCGLWFPFGWPEIELGYGLARSAWGQGFASEAGRAVAAAAADAGVPSLVSYIDPRNRPSQRVARAVGAHCEATITVIGKPCGRWRYPLEGRA